MARKWTPGPWRAIPETPGPTLVVAGDYADQGEPDLIVEVTSEDEIANANLIAAAPDLYEALVEVLNIAWSLNARVVSGWKERELAFRSADAALAKARGEATT